MKGTSAAEPRAFRPSFVPGARVTLVTAFLFAVMACTRNSPPKRGDDTHPDIKATPVKVVEVPVGARGIWVWKTAARLSDPMFKTKLEDTVRSARLNEVYLSVGGDVLHDQRLPELVGALRKLDVRVEALMGEAVWYRVEKRAPMFSLIDQVGAYNERYPNGPFAGVHLDIEPHQIVKSDHKYLPALAETLVQGHNHAAKRNLTSSADLPRFALDEEGPLFARATGRIFLMLYELRDRSVDRLVDVSTSVLGGTYEGAGPDVVSRMVIGLSATDYPSNLEPMLSALDVAHDKAAHYGGWAIHDDATFTVRKAP